MRKYEITVDGRHYATAKTAVMADYYFSRALEYFPPWTKIKIEIKEN